ncbi:MAG: Gfo/Idh/MocA family oxidoreductase [Clostridiales bacterium]|nr:Gfo/Idh/MocA family oxidoreductase [Clostridiales bacterium]
MAVELKYGMVGGGPGAFIGDAHRKAIAVDGKAKLTAGCFSRNYEKTVACGADLGISKERCYADYKEMAQAEAQREDAIDFVVVVTPNASHYEICKAFLEAGIHVVCDKPVTVELKQAEELERIAKEKSLLFMVTYTYTGHVTAKQARAMIQKGEIGEVRTVLTEYPQGWLAFEDDWGGKQGEWRCDPRQTGRSNALGDVGTHVENMIATMTGLKIKRVLAKMDVVVPGRVLDDNDFVMVEYDNGASGMYWASQIAIGCDNSLRVRIYGSKGTILWFQEDSEKLIYIDADSMIHELHRGYAQIDPSAAKYGRLPSGHTEGWLEAMGNLYSSYVDCIVTMGKGEFDVSMIDFPTVSAGVEGLKFVEACLESSEKGNIWVDIAD